MLCEALLKCYPQKQHIVFVFVWGLLISYQRSLVEECDIVPRYQPQIAEKASCGEVGSCQRRGKVKIETLSGPAEIEWIGTCSHMPLHKQTGQGETIIGSVIFFFSRSRLRSPETRGKVLLEKHTRQLSSYSLFAGSGGWTRSARRLNQTLRSCYALFSFHEIASTKTTSKLIQALLIQNYFSGAMHPLRRHTNERTYIFSLSPRTHTCRAFIWKRLCLTTRWIPLY